MRRFIGLLLVILFAGCDEQQLPPVAAIQTKDIFELAIDSEKTIEANGINFYTVTATFTRDVKAEKRKVRFQSTLGKFNDGNSFVDVVADADGKAAAYLKSDSVGVGTVKATVDTKYSIDIPVTFVSPSSEFTITTEPSTLPVEADGVTHFKIGVEFKEAVPQGNRKVTLKTSLGKFPNDLTTITLSADDSGMATTFLKSIDIGTAIVSFQSLTKKTSIEKSLSFSIPQPAFQLKVLTSGTVPADNISSHKIEVEFLKFNTLADRKILLETTLGKFTNNDVKINLIADEANKAFAYLKSDKIGIATLKATFENKISQEITATFGVPLPAFEFIAQPATSVPADNFSTHNVEVLFKTFESLASRRVFLKTTIGTFGNGRDTITLLSNSENKGKTTLKSASEGIASVIASFQKSLIQEISYTFSKAFPERLLLTSPAFSVKAGLENQIKFETLLLKTNGNVSAGFNIDYTAVDTLGNPIGAFINNISSRADGKATVDFSSGPALKPGGQKTYRGRVRIRALLTLTGPPLTDDIDIYVID